MGGIVFELPADYFVRGYDRFNEAGCRGLLLSPTGKYTKFPPFLFPDRKDLSPSSFLKTATLVHVRIIISFFKCALKLNLLIGSLRCLLWEVFRSGWYWCTRTEMQGQVVGN